MRYNCELSSAYHIERVELENVLSRVINALAFDVEALPLVHEEELVGVLEPTDVLDPRQPRRHQLGVGEEAAEEEEGEDEGGADCCCDCDVGSQTGYEVP